MARAHDPAREIVKALDAAGVISDIDGISRIVIDIQAGALPQVFVQRDGNGALADLAPLLAEAVVTDRPEPVRYWVECSDELMAAHACWPSFLRPLKRDDSAVPLGDSHWWLFEDDDAPAGLDGKRVVLTITRGQTEQDGPYETRVERREVNP